MAADVVLLLIASADVVVVAAGVVGGPAELEVEADGGATLEAEFELVLVETV